MAKVVFLNGEDAGREIVLEPDSVATLGRQEDCEICVANVPGVSRHHARFRFVDGRWVVEDLGSQNGIYFGDEKIERRELQPDDVLWFSNLSVRFEPDGEKAASETGEHPGPPAESPAAEDAAADSVKLRLEDTPPVADDLPFDPDRVPKIGEQVKRIRAEFRKVIVGQEQVLDELMVALLASGHCLMIGLPGLAKTLMIRTLADILELRFKRIQFTPDLMPTDIIGSDVLEIDEETGRRSFRFIHGPVFTNLLLADEINRTPPKTQAALLEAMQERQVTAANHLFPLPSPFFVLATQNPLEQEGTYPLPEAQLDRFMFNIIVDYPTEDEEEQVVAETTGGRRAEVECVLSGEELLEIQGIVRSLPVSPHVIKYATRLARATRPGDRLAPDYIKQYVTCGAGPRAAQFLVLGAKAMAVLEGKLNVSCDHVRELALPIMRHRIFTSFHADSEGVTPDDLIRRLVLNVSQPGPDEY